MAKLFNELNLDDFDQSALTQMFVDDLRNTSKVFLTFKYTKGRKIVIYELTLNTSEINLDILQGKAVKDDDGSQTFELGSFKKGTKLKISFGVLAFTPVPKAIAIVAQTNPDDAIQVDPKQPGKTKKLERSELWEKDFQYTVR